MSIRTFVNLYYCFEYNVRHHVDVFVTASLCYNPMGGVQLEFVCFHTYVFGSLSFRVLFEIGVHLSVIRIFLLNGSSVL